MDRAPTPTRKPIGEQHGSPHTDHLGSTSLLSDEVGTAVPGSQARYLPFGGYRVEPTAGLTDHGFTGHKHNDPLGLIYMRARFYVPGIGRFASADTIVPDPANPQSLNRFSYVGNNPLLYIDPSGHTECMDADCNWIVHPVTGEIEWSGPGPEPDQSYDKSESVKQAWAIGLGWLLEIGPETWELGRDNPLTQDLMQDIGVKQARQAWADRGYPDKWTYYHDINTTGGGLFGAHWAFAREQIYMLLSSAGFSSSQSEGDIDMIGFLLGSYDVTFNHLGAGRVQVMVHNVSDWQSFTRKTYSKDEFWRPSQPRGSHPREIPWMLHDDGTPYSFSFGGTIEQYFVWIEAVR